MMQQKKNGETKKPEEADDDHDNWRLMIKERSSIYNKRKKILKTIKLKPKPKRS